MASNAINSPRIDRAFVNGSGQLTEYGYSVLARIIERVGGTVGDILNGAQLTAAIEALSLLPAPRDWSAEIAELQRSIGILPPQVIPLARLSDDHGKELAAIVATLARKVNDLENAP